MADEVKTGSQRLQVNLCLGSSQSMLLLNLILRGDTSTIVAEFTITRLKPSTDDQHMGTLPGYPELTLLRFKLAMSRHMQIVMG